METLTEKQIEDVFETFHEHLLEPGLTLIERQYVFDNRLRADLLFRDKNDTTVVLELNRNEVTRENIGQIFEYHGMFDAPKTRIILAAPFIPESIRKSFEHFGIEYIQFSLTEIERLYRSMKDKPEKAIFKEKLFSPKTILTRPLAQKIKDGNIAFKVTFNDNNWSGVCSKDIANYNFIHRTWCGIQSEHKINCQNKTWTKDKPNENYFPCHDSVALKLFSFSPGHSYGPKHENEPKRCIGAKMCKLAIFTYREPSATEAERFIIAIGQINAIKTLIDSDFEQINCDKKTGLFFLGTEKPKFWKHYRNSNTERIAWNTGLFRYLDDTTTRNILEDTIMTTRLTKQEQENAKYFLEQL